MVAGLLFVKYHGQKAPVIELLRTRGWLSSAFLSQEKTAMGRAIVKNLDSGRVEAEGDVQRVPSNHKGRIVGLGKRPPYSNRFSLGTRVRRIRNEDIE